MNEKTNIQANNKDHLFFYRNGLVVSFHPLDEKNNGVKLESKYGNYFDENDAKTDYDDDRNSKSSYNDKVSNIDQRIITQLEEENYQLFELTKEQQEKIKRLEEKNGNSVGGTIFCC